MLLIVAVHPTRFLELIKYQQTISKAATKFKGLAWLTYDEQFRRRAANDLSKAWDKIDLELWTVTFSGLVKPHCSVCFNSYHQAEDCPNQDPSRKPRCQALVCFDFNKPSVCQRRSCYFPHTCRRYGSGNHAQFNCPGPNPFRSSNRPANPAIAARNEVVQRQLDCSHTVSTPLKVDKLALELVNHPNSSFVSNLITALRYGTRIGYLGPHKTRVSRNLISAFQDPDVVSGNINKEMPFPPSRGTRTAPIPLGRSVSFSFAL